MAREVKPTRSGTSGKSFAAELKARLAAADRYDRRVAAKRQRQNELLKETEQQRAKFNLAPPKPPAEWQSAIAKCVPSTPSASIGKTLADIRDASKLSAKSQSVIAGHAPSTSSALQSIGDTLTDIRDAVTKDAASAPQWSGTVEDFLITAVFPEHAIRPGEVVWSEKRDNDYSRRIAGICWDQHRMRVKPWTVKNAWGKRPKK
jgi:hypothetical protein